MIIKPTSCYLMISNDGERSPVERYSETLQRLADLLTIPNNKNWVCSYEFVVGSSGLSSNGLGGFALSLENVKPSYMMISKNGEPLDFENFDEVLTFDFSTMTIVVGKEDLTNGGPLPTIDDIKQYIEQSTRTVSAKNQSRTMLESLTVDFLTGMCSISRTQAKTMAKNYSKSISDEDLKKFPSTEHGTIFRIASDWGRRKEAFGQY